ncbi:ABC transporter ATP-binding protein [Nocardioides sp.]|uniref:ABC transporter ATP-binding protein n=1 Tax=Nocardioides sp. TaxID=35761 RepID=UPI0027357D25|nr:ABC transporter ATP-binding protein [Nocardioides sp.]MDP3894973.1 ABC transporter ATP-binding protein [Nocardioides sp.]
MTDPRLELHEVHRTYPTGGGVQGVSLRIAPGRIHALVGLNGAGKSTLMRLVLGMLRPDSGTIAIDGTELRSAAASLWSAVGHLAETPFAYPELSTRDNLVLAARLRGVAPGSIAALVDASLEDLALTAYADRRAGRLSLGNRQRLGIAAALQHRPSLLVLDEPGNGLDPAGVLLLRGAIRRLASECGTGVLVSSHHLDEVARIADHISVINEGRLIGTLDPAGFDLERTFFDLVRLDAAAPGSGEPR